MTKPTIPDGWHKGPPREFRVRDDSNKCGFPPKVTLKLEKQAGLNEKHFSDLVWVGSLDEHLITTTNEYWGMKISYFFAFC